MSSRHGSFGADEGFRRLAARIRAAREETRVRVLIADDHVLFAESIALMLELEDEIEVVGHATDGREAAALATMLRPDVVVMDLDMPVMNGIDAAAAVRRSSPGTRVVIVTGSRDADDERRAREAGAAAYVHKGNSVERLREAVYGVARQVIPLETARASIRRSA